MRDLPDYACLQERLVCTDAFGIWFLAYIQAVGFVKWVESSSSYQHYCCFLTLQFPILGFLPVTGKKRKIGYQVKALSLPESQELGSKHVLVFPQTLCLETLVVSVVEVEKRWAPFDSLRLGAAVSLKDSSLPPTRIYFPSSLSIHCPSWYSFVMQPLDRSELGPVTLEGSLFRDAWAETPFNSLNSSTNSEGSWPLILLHTQTIILYHWDGVSFWPRKH